MFLLIISAIILIAIFIYWYRKNNAVAKAAAVESKWDAAVNDREYTLSTGSFSDMAEKRWDIIESLVTPHVRKVALHYTDWCPACQNMRPIWNAARAELGEKIKFSEIDEDVAKTPGILGYPTIRLVDERGYTRQYNGPADLAALRAWLMQI